MHEKLSGGLFLSLSSKIKRTFNDPYKTKFLCEFWLIEDNKKVAGHSYHLMCCLSITNTQNNYVDIINWVFPLLNLICIEYFPIKQFINY